jgi:hypothetical protein
VEPDDRFGLGFGFMSACPGEASAAASSGVSPRPRGAHLAIHRTSSAKIPGAK